MRIGILALLQESNTFISQPTRFEQFEQDLLACGEEVRERLAGTHHEVAGMFHALEEEGAEAVPIFAARAYPFGVIEGDAIERLLGIMFAELEKAGKLDGVLVAPHGATVSQPFSDVDGHWLSEVRRRLGPLKAPVRVELVAYDELPRNALGKVLKRELRDRVTVDSLS